jgi:hypothetical protein
MNIRKGQRYNRETLDIKFKGKSIADVLKMTVDEAAEFFKAVPAVRDKMETLSGGEALWRFRSAASSLEASHDQRNDEPPKRNAEQSGAEVSKGFHKDRIVALKPGAGNSAALLGFR